MSTGRKRRPADTSSRRAEQAALPLAPPAEPTSQPAAPQARAELPAAPRPVPKRQPEAPQRPAAGGWEVLWVRCEECGRGRHVDAAGRHGAMPVRQVTLEGHPTWPRCQHAVPYWENCRGAPVAPPCCLESTP
ncbi:MAG TPA: hypothetical protein VFZ09_27640 [Archangium sp.]|uniref:hypothetical protein n=1 Tax=Archangium sp. TaxID=1872627 RepID=UPI002E2F5EA2|nr:hypothetical protein [Archangium sp.]HEX5750034.1 hypothetical protein [Archangium sp.]